MSLYTRMIEHLLPRATTWQIVITTQMKQFFEGLSDIPFQVRMFLDGIWGDIWPSQTTQLGEWEFEFDLPSNVTVDADRRSRLDGRWAATGGQDPTYLQDTLNEAGFPVFIHEFFSNPPVIPPVAAIVRDPTSAPIPNFILVNKILTVTNATMGAGEVINQAGEPSAQAGEFITPAVSNSEFVYTTPTDPLLWPYFIYWGDAVFGDVVDLPIERKEEFELLCLAICPGQNWLGMFITYS